MSAFNCEKRTVYFVKPIGMSGPIKIGSTLCVKTRICQLFTSSPFPLELIATIDGDLQMERSFQKRFSHLKSHKEWFHPGADLLAFIAQIPSEAAARETAA